MSRNVADARRGRFVFVIPIKRAGRTTMLSIKINEFQKIPSQNVNGRPLLRVCGGDGEHAFSRHLLRFSARDFLLDLSFVSPVVYAHLMT